MKSELLVPVGNQEALQAAVQSGADAIYLGGKKFNARGNAGNFSNDELLEAIRYAHLYGVKVYVTFNTLIKEKEMAEAREFAEFLYYSHCDAVIVQDLGIAAMIKRYFPQLDLHASTQMTIHNLDGVRVLEDMGFKRVVLARELNIDEIDYIAHRTNLELETFVHGALCVCYSGQCLMSSMLGGRSGNRGLCAQPCRLPYTLQGSGQSNDEGKPSKQLLSTKDLAAYPFLPDIIKAGVRSLKIEGRMKRPEYIAVVTRIYRKLLDNIYEGKVPGYSPEDEEELLQIFNRGGFCSGYYFDTNNRELMSSGKPGHWGVYVGKVLNVRGRWIDIKLESELEVGDGIEFRTVYHNKDWGQEVTSIRSNRGKELTVAAPGSIISVRNESEKNVVPSSEVWRISSKRQIEEAVKQLNQRYAKKIDVCVRGVFKKGEIPLIEITDSNGIKGLAFGEQNIEAARKAPLSLENVEKQISRMGDTPFGISNMDIQMDKDIFMPLSVINDLRRKAVADLVEKRISSMEPPRPVVKVGIENPFHATREEDHRKQKLYIYTEKMIEDDEILRFIDGVAFVPKNWNMDFAVLRDHISNLKVKGIETRLVLPRIMRHEDIEKIDHVNSGIWGLFDAYQVGNLGGVHFLKSKGIENITGDYSLNVFNSIAVGELARLGVKSLVVSPELHYREIGDVAARAAIPCEIMIFGYTPLMIMEYCPVGDIKKDCRHCELEHNYKLVDRKGMAFSMRKRKIARCYTEILNSQLLIVIDELERIAESGVQGYGLDLTGFGLDEIKNIVKLHRSVMDNPNKDFSPDMKDVLERLKRIGFTRGHFFRGVE